MQSGINYNPGIGFESFQDYSLAKANFRYGIFPKGEIFFFMARPWR